jgi:hypothetical protein
MTTAKGGATPAPAPAVLVTGRTAEELAQMAALSVGAQVILDFNGAGSIGARGGAGTSIEENTAARDAHLAALGYDPAAPSGPPTAPDPAGAVRSADGPIKGRATRMSSLAAGIITDLSDIPGAPPTSAPINVDVPHASQSGATLNCTMGNWQQTPTGYAYAWTIDGAAAGTAADYTVTPADVGKSATCIVTATNAVGSTAAPPSNAVTITDPAGATRTRRS